MQTGREVSHRECVRLLIQGKTREAEVIRSVCLCAAQTSPPQTRDRERDLGISAVIAHSLPDSQRSGWDRAACARGTYAEKRPRAIDRVSPRLGS
ncbi:hypothetical protein AAFF_G00093610 [Aldrovandia affinis]|uniref:Uncharacterized protein n=1 Tax=Aldrovandia affinis TaxID=143900 RepID=A0AAD7T370_9TELE|nr:hypothetical protein AAFF_G00093610 [Aldrovandia affinis]